MGMADFHFFGSRRQRLPLEGSAMASAPTPGAQEGCGAVVVQRQGRDREQGPVFLDFEETFNVEACFMSIIHIKHCYCYWDCISP